MPTADYDAPPGPVDELLPQVRAWAAELDELPSRNRIMAEFRIGTTKATTILSQLKASESASSGDGDGDSEPGLPRRLRAVPDRDSTGNRDGAPRPVDEDAESLPADDDHDEHNGGAQIDAVRAEPAESSPGHASPPQLPDLLMGKQVPAPEHLDYGSARVTWPVPRGVRVWPLLLLALPAFVSIWSGWVGLGELAGFGVVHPLPGIFPGVQLNTAITLPIGVETYAAYALRIWLAGDVPTSARRFARASAIGSLVLGALGQVAYHLLTAAGFTSAPWWITTLVACLPVAVLGMGAALAHLLRHHTDDPSRA